ncbi:zinc ribbon domain-containing protein [Neobacillus drentensis]|uniref:zinc ribbon domain-containing protein n=1 Tax=Neobacillus drentensis TaxID=220684 RepID=UPI003B587D0E
MVAVNPQCTSQKCNVCGHSAKEYRKTQAEFQCVSCGHMDHADSNATKNIRDLALAL